MATDSTASGQPAFAFTELLIAVFEHLYPRDLHKVALVCKRWSPIALEARWKNHPVRLSRLLQRLSPLGEIDYGIHLARNVDLTSVNLDSWTVFHRDYSRKVKHLDLDILVTPLSAAVIQNVAETLGESVCPNLVSAEIHIDTTGYITLADSYTSTLSLLCTAVTKIIVEGDGYDNIEETADVQGVDFILALLASRASNITAATLSLALYSVNYAPLFQLKTLELQGGTLLPAGWRALAACPLLESVSYDREIGQGSFEDDDDEEREEHFRDGREVEVVLPSLRRLELSGTKWDSSDALVTIFLHSTMPSLRKVAFETCALGCATTKYIFRWFGSRFRLIEELTIEWDGVDQSGDYPLDWQTDLRYLNLLRNMRRLTFSGATPAYDSESIRRLAHSMPNLQVLHLSTPYGRCQHGACGSLQNLVTLAKYTGASLSDLSISLNVTSEELASLGERKNVQGHHVYPTKTFRALRHLTFVHLGLPREESVPVLVNLMARLFPKVETMAIHCFWLETQSEQLAQVGGKDFIRLFFECRDTPKRQKT